MPRVIWPGDPEDAQPLGELCAAAARQLAAASPSDPRRHRIDVYRPVTVDGRMMMVRVKLTIVHVSADRNSGP